MAFLELKNVSKGFGEGKDRSEVLKNINLTMEEGDFLAIIGFSGSGKSTLMSVLYGFYAADSGSIEVFGQPATIKNADDAIALGIGMALATML